MTVGEELLPRYVVTPPSTEGESGLETIGFETSKISESRRVIMRPTSTQVWFNKTNSGTQATGIQPAPAYWGNFITLFDGTIVGGTRLDGVGIGWAVNFGDANRCSARGNGGTTPPPQNKTLPAQYTFNTVGAKGSNVGIDIFFRKSMTNVTVTVDTVGGVSIFAVIANNPAYADWYPLGSPIITRPRPEGYQSGEDGVQILWNPKTAEAVPPAGFVNPAAVGVPSSPAVDAGGNRINMLVIP